MGFFQAIYGVGMFIGPVLIGLIVDRLNLSGGFFSIAALASMGLIMTYVLLKGNLQGEQR